MPRRATVGRMRHQDAGQRQRTLRRTVPLRRQLFGRVARRDAVRRRQFLLLLDDHWWPGGLLRWHVSRIRLRRLRHHAGRVATCIQTRSLHQILKSATQLLETLRFGLVDALVLDVLGLGH